MRPVGSTLRDSERALCDSYDVALLDLDGVVYIGPDAIPGAPRALTVARERGMRLGFVTNNAARAPDVVAAHLTDLGIAAQPDEIITSAQAAARYLSERLPAGSPVLVVGTTGLEVALRERGLKPVARAGREADHDAVAAVVQGYSPELGWRQLAEGAVAINSGALWVATNIDPTVPSPRGPLPGNGSLVAALRHATRREPVVTGKPDPAMHRESLLRSGAERPIVVGDRLDTDIEGANAVGCPSLLVLSGVTGAADLLAAPARQRPTYLGRDVAALLERHPAVDAGGDRVRCGHWAVLERDGVWWLLLAEPGTRDTEMPADAAADDPLDALRALCGAIWAAGARAEAREPAVQDPGLSRGQVRCDADDPAAREVLRGLGLLSAG